MMKLQGVSRNSPQNASEKVPSATEDIAFDVKIPKERYIYREKRQQIIDELRSI